MRQSQLYDVKTDILDLLSTQSPLSQEEIKGDSRFRETPEPTLELALMRLEMEEKITVDNMDFIHITEKSKQLLKKLIR
jgi:hypothetical protein